VSINPNEKAIRYELWTIKKQLPMTHNLQRCFWASACALGILCATQASHAAAIVGSMQEAFDYPDTTQFVNSSTLNGGQGWNATGTTAPNDAGANWGSILNAGNAIYRTATAPGLSYSATGYLPASGNRLTLDGATANQTQNTGRTLGGQTIDTGSTYFSLLMSKNNDTIRTMNWAFFNGTSERFAVGMIGATAGNTAGNIGLLMNNSNPGGLVQSGTPIAMGLGITHLLVGRIDWNAGGFETVSLWVDPSDVTTEGAAGAIYASTSAFELTAITAVRPFAGNNATVGGNPVTGVIANFDEFRIGGTWESVTSLTPVPEPTTGALVALGLGLALVLRRRRSR
jgi:hypothetical protein